MMSEIQNGLSKRYVVTEGIRDKNGHTFLVTGVEWAMAKHTKDKDAAWELIKFLSGPVTQKLAWQNTLDLPSWKKADWVNTKELPYAPAFLAAAAAGRNAFFPEFMFTTFRPWIAQQVSLAIHGGHPDISGGLQQMQQKGEAWAKTQTMQLG
jgi:ABC-type glycerol-3-phosphate transport system substrate-binding protein